MRRLVISDGEYGAVIAALTELKNRELAAARAADIATNRDAHNLAAKRVFDLIEKLNEAETF